MYSLIDIVLHFLTFLHFYSTIHSIDNNYIYFIRMRKAVSAYANRRIPFFFYTCFTDATHLIRVPIKTFIEEVKVRLGDCPTCKIVLLQNVGRCGSTLICHMLGASNPAKIASISEHDMFVNLNKMKLHMESGHFLQLVNACLTYRL